MTLAIAQNYDKFEYNETTCLFEPQDVITFNISMFEHDAIIELEMR